MVTIGIRAAPKTVTFAIYDSDIRRIINLEEIRIPAAFTVPDGLKYLRSNLLDVLREFEVERAGIRLTEAVASTNIERVQIEGVIQEAAKLGVKTTAVKPLVDGDENYAIEGWGQMSKEGREAVLTAVGAANA